MDDQRAAELGERLRAALADTFEVGELLGAGGFAAVFHARDRTLGRDVAIKAFETSEALSPATEEWLREARLVATSEHPHIVPLYEAGRRDGLVYLVMRFLPETAADLLQREGRLSPADVVRIGLEVAEALDTAHRQGVVHLDIKPENILLDAQGRAAVADFGIARMMERGDDEDARRVSGTPHYMSPEQVAGDRVDGRADLYALGVVLYELATGRRPITGKNSSQIMAAQVSQEPPLLSRMAPDLPKALAELVMKALAKDPAARWASAGDMAAALRAAGTPDGLLSPRSARRRTRRRWYLRAALAAGGLLAGTALVGYVAYRLFVALGSGDRPALDAFAPSITPAVLDSARALGILAPDDTAEYVFAPHGHGTADALYITTRHLVIRQGNGVRRYPLAEDPDVNVAFRNTRGWLTVAAQRGAPPDTLFADLSGRESRALFSSLQRVLQGDR